MSRFELGTFIPGKEDQFRSLLASTFIGCEEELGQLKHFLDDAMAGGGHFIVISGEAGTGKTKLTHQFVLDAERQGIVALEEKFDAESRYNPYAIFFRIIERLGQHKMKDAVAVQTHLAKLMHPENGNGGKKKGTADLSSLYSLQSQFGLVQQKLVASILEYTKDDTLILVLTDLHLAPLTTWQFIHYFSKSLVEQKILVLVTLRQDGREISQQKIPPYADVLQRMNRERLVDRIGLQRFDLQKTREFLNTVFKRSDFSSKLLPWLYEISGGIPGTLAASLQALFDQGIIYKQKGVWFNREDLKKETLIRFVLGEVHAKEILRSTTNLPERQRKIVEYGALLDDSFDYILISAILNISRIQVVKELMQLKDKKILIESENRNYKFKNSAIATAILADMPAEQLSVMHHNIAQAINSSEQMESPRKEYLMAHHYLHSTEREKAFPYLLKAFDAAIANFAFIEAKEFYQDAVSLISDGAHPYDPADLLYLYFKMTWLSRVLGKYREGIEYAELGLKLSEELTDVEMKNQILIQKGLTYFRLNRWQEARDCLHSCLHSDVSDNGFIEAMANFGLGNVCLELSEYSRAVDYYHNALHLARQLDAEPLAGTLYNNLGIIENILGNHLKSVQMYIKCIPIFEKIGDHFGLARIYHNIGMSYADETSWKKANEFYGKSLSVSDVMGLVPLKSITFLNRANALIHLNRYEEAQEYNFKAYRLLTRLNDELGISEYHKVQGILEREKKNWPESVKHFEQAIKKFHALQNKLGVAETKYERAIMEISAGNPENGIKWLRKCKEDYTNLGLKEKMKNIEKMLAEIVRKEVVMNDEVLYD